MGSGSDNDHSDKLPARITSVQPQKRNKERYSLFIGEELFLLGVSESTLLEYNLNKGTKITPRLFTQLQKVEGRQAVKEYIIKMLGRRDHSRKELFDKTIKKDHPPEIIHSVLDEMEEKGYLDDRSFAEKFASEKSRLNSWGPAKIKSHLYKKGISRSVAEESIDTAFEGIDLKQTFFELLSKKRRRFLQESDLFKRKKKIFDYLKRKGYRSHSIMNCLDELAESIEK